jgi:predicted NAD-dependent protein-ADP-ribosyltransferase YbiA (DUF1768 family)
MITNLINIKSGQPYHVYIGRYNEHYNLSESKWHNPYIIGKHGDRNFCIEKYKLYINTRPDLIRSVSELKGNTLGCWCFPENCHGYHLIHLAENKYVMNWFSNMIPFDKSLIYQDTEYKTVENFYQAMKIPKDKIILRKEIAAMKPFESKKEIRNKDKYPWDCEWTREKSLKVMEYALRWKFQKGTSWHTKLHMTENWEITEWSNWGDVFWAKDINTEIGQNNLGKLLMNIRQEICNN